MLGAMFTDRDLAKRRSDRGHDQDAAQERRAIQELGSARSVGSCAAAFCWPRSDKHRGESRGSNDGDRLGSPTRLAIARGAPDGGDSWPAVLTDGLPTVETARRPRLSAKACIRPT